MSSMALRSSCLAALKAAFSSERCFVMSSISPMMVWMASMVSTFSSSRVAMSSVSLSILALFFLICQSRSLTVEVIFWYSPLQWSRFSMSAAPSSWMAAIILSISEMTLSKWPTFAMRTLTASCAMRRLFERVALSAA